ncbi:MAG: glycine cleavage system aminomethyltransferase GcvT [Mariprofundaceae bacterium]|nr:glycine cleavage system aminomethyltransferase GcvT [Mariprofundaceae bacterium]
MELKNTALHAQHLELGGKMVPFAGFSMPVQYTLGALKEYHCVRAEDSCGIFDISHMGQVRVTGPDALAFLQFFSTNDVSQLKDGQVQYAALLDENAGFIDDITVYRINATHYYLCINAANTDKDVAHLQEHAQAFNVTVIDESPQTALLALQGATAQALLQAICQENLADIAYYRFAEVSLLGQKALISRTGYTGEDGFELYLPNQDAAAVWSNLVTAGAIPIGLAARDMLRTEMGYALYGHEIHADITPVEAGLMWICKLDKGNFMGRDALITRKENGKQWQKVALKLEGRGIPREHYAVFANDEQVGEVTSGLFSPLAGGGVALAYVKPEQADAVLNIDIRGRKIPTTRTKTPFVRSCVKK